MVDDVLEHMMALEEPIEEEDENNNNGGSNNNVNENDDDGSDEREPLFGDEEAASNNATQSKRSRRQKKRQRASDPISALLAEDALQSREEGAVETSFMLADMALLRSSNSSSIVPEFFRGRITVYVEKTPIGVLQLTEKVWNAWGVFLSFDVVVSSVFCRTLCWMYVAKWGD